MIVQFPEPLKLLGKLDTRIVGIQYYDGAKALGAPEVILKRTPENSHDANAIAVFTPQDCPIGHLPRYDAAYFAPLVDNGVIVLKGKAGKPEDKYQLPLTLEIYATPKASELFALDEGNDWRAIFHNLFIGLWERLDQYSCAALKEFRARFRPLAHEQELYPKTQLFYRMLKSRIEELDRQEDERFKELILSAVIGMSFGPRKGWADFAVLPLDVPGLPNGPSAESTAPDLLPEPYHLPSLVRQLPERCPCPQGAHGAVLVVAGALNSLDWFAAAECAQVYWYQPFVDAFQHIDGESRNTGEPRLPKTSEETKADVLAALEAAEYSAKSVGNIGGIAVEVFGYGHNATAIFQDDDMVCLRLRPLGHSVPKIALYESKNDHPAKQG